MGKNANNNLKKQVGAPAIIGAIAGLIVLLGIFYFIFLRPSEPAVPQGHAPDADATSNATTPGGAPNMPQPPPGDTDKEHVGPDTSGTPR